MAVDTGGPSREFWRLFMCAVGERYTLGGELGKVFDRNIVALQVL